MRVFLLGWLIFCAGCPEPATDGPIPTRPAPTPRLDAAAPLDLGADGATLDATPLDATLDALTDAAAPDAAVDAAPTHDPCAASDRRPHLELGPSGDAVFAPWAPDAMIPLIRLSQGGSVTRFDLLAVDVDAAADGLTLQIIDLDTEQELAFGRTDALDLPCRPGVGRLLVDRRVDYAGDFAAIDLIGRRVRIIATLHTPRGDVFGGAEGTLEAAR